MWAAALLAFNEFHIGLSATAEGRVFMLFFAALALLSFTRFLRTERSTHLYLAGLFTALAHLSTERGMLLLPAFGAALLFKRYRGWLLRPAPYIAALPTLAAIGFALDSDAVRFRMVLIDGLGFDPRFTMFYLRDIAAGIARLGEGLEVGET